MGSYLGPAYLGDLLSFASMFHQQQIMLLLLNFGFSGTQSQLECLFSLPAVQEQTYERNVLSIYGHLAQERHIQVTCHSFIMHVAFSLLTIIWGMVAE